ncbi:MAG: hypothetical protein MZV64_34065 [Ignavibacteriales bacterium]|nr:hypothetical protein [Ignavibacteriales bacterium]
MPLSAGDDLAAAAGRGGPRPRRRLPGLPDGNSKSSGRRWRGIRAAAEGGERPGLERGRMAGPDGPRGRGGEGDRQAPGGRRPALQPRWAAASVMGAFLGLVVLGVLFKGPAPRPDRRRAQRGARRGANREQDVSPDHGLAGDRAPDRLVPRQEFRLERRRTNEKRHDRASRAGFHAGPSSVPALRRRTRRPRHAQRRGPTEADRGLKNLRKEIVKLKYRPGRKTSRTSSIRLLSASEGISSSIPNMPSILSVSDTPGERRQDPGRHPRDRRQAGRRPLHGPARPRARRADAATDAELKNDPIIKELRQAPPVSRATRFSMSRWCAPSTGRVRRSSSARRPNSSSCSSRTSPGTPRCRSSRPRSGCGGSSTARLPPSPTSPNTSTTATLIESALNIKSGERTVVGVSKLDGGDKGLILIISAKIVD